LIYLKHIVSLQEVIRDSESNFLTSYAYSAESES